MTPRAALTVDVILYTLVVALSLAVTVLIAVVWYSTGDPRGGWALALLVTGLVLCHLRLIEGWQQR